MDYTNIRHLLLEEYITTQGPSEEEIDAYDLGMIHLINEIDTGRLANADIPFTKAEVIRLERANNNLRQNLDLEISINKKLQGELKNIQQMSKEDRYLLRREVEYTRLKEELQKTQIKLSEMTNDRDIWISRYATK